MKKRFLSLLMVFCLMLSLAPAAFAVDAERPTPEAMFLSAEDIASAASVPSPLSSNSGSGTSADDPYVITSTADFAELMNKFADYVGVRYVRLDADIDVSSLSVSEWHGLFTYFYGVFDGNEHTISGIPENCFMIYAWLGGVIKDLTIDLKGKASTMVYMQYGFQNSSGNVEYATATLSNVKVKSTDSNGNPVTVALTSNDQANYAPFIFSSGPYFTMDNCVNYADISGNVYASVFYGYYPLANGGFPSDGYVKIQNCENHGNVSYRYAGLIFGNPSALEGKNISVSNVKNYGILRGTDSVHVFSSDAGSNSVATGYTTNGNYFNTMEATLTDVNGSCTDTDCPKYNTTAHANGAICNGVELTGFALSVNNSNQYVITQPNDNTNVSYYVVTAYRYVAMFNAAGDYAGTNRISLSQTLEKGSNSLTVTDFLDLQVTDGSLPEGATTYLLDEGQRLYLCVSNNNASYWINNSLIANSGYFQYLNANKSAGSYNWEVYASAYDSNGQMLDTVALSRS